MNTQSTVVGSDKDTDIKALESSCESILQQSRLLDGLQGRELHSHAQSCSAGASALRIRIATAGTDLLRQVHSDGLWSYSTRQSDERIETLQTALETVQTRCEMAEMRVKYDSLQAKLHREEKLHEMQVARNAVAASWVALADREYLQSRHTAHNTDDTENLPVEAQLRLQLEVDYETDLAGYEAFADSIQKLQALRHASPDIASQGGIESPRMAMSHAESCYIELQKRFERLENVQREADEALRAAERVGRQQAE